MFVAHFSLLSGEPCERSYRNMKIYKKTLCSSGKSRKSGIMLTQASPKQTLTGGPRGPGSGNRL